MAAVPDSSAKSTPPRPRSIARPNWSPAPCRRIRSEPRLPLGNSVSRDAYGSYQELLDAEAKLPADQRVDFVSIATPNHTHCEIACAALEAGFHVVCDKPMTTNLADAQKMVDTVARTGRVFALTHNYSGYPLMRQAREMIRGGELGEIIAVRATYVQGWMHGIDPDTTPARGAWKSDPNLNGQAGSLGDVGTHAFHLTRFVTGSTAAVVVMSNGILFQPSPAG